MLPGHRSAGGGDVVLDAYAGFVAPALGAGKRRSGAGMSAVPKVDRGLLQALVVLLLLAVPFLIAKNAMLRRSTLHAAPVLLQPQAGGAPADDATAVAPGNHDLAAYGAGAKFEVDRTIPDLSEIEWRAIVHNAELEPASLEQIKAARQRAVAAQSQSGGGGVTLIAACANHWMHLSLAIQSWRKVRGVREIVFVDWSEAQHSTRVARKFGGEQVFIVHVNASEWVLSQAYNLAAALATQPRLLKVDCDTLLADDVLERHVLADDQRAYYTVQWSESQNERRLRGVFLTHREFFEAVGGYDERIDSYGFEDVELYKRFDNVGLVALEFDLNTMHHMPFEEEHFDALESANETKSVVLSPTYLVRRNRLLLQKLADPWSRAAAEANGAKYAFRAASHALSGGEPLNIALAEQTSRVQGLAELVGKQTALKIEAEARRLMLHDDCFVPWDILNQISAEPRKMAASDSGGALLENEIMSDLEYVANALDPAAGTEKRLLVAEIPTRDAFAMSVGLTWSIFLAVSRNRVLVVVLPKAEHNVQLEELFDIERTRARLKSMVGIELRFIFAHEWPCSSTVADCAQFDHAYQTLHEMDLVNTPELVVLEPTKNVVVHLRSIFDMQRSVESIPKLERHVYTALLPTRELLKVVRKSGDMSDVTALYLSDVPEMWDNLERWLIGVIENTLRILASDNADALEKPKMLVTGANHTTVSRANAILEQRNDVEVVQHQQLPQDGDAAAGGAYSLHHQLVEMQLLLRCKRLYFDDYVPLEWKVIIKYTLAWRKFNAPSLPNDMRRQYTNLIDRTRNIHVPREMVFHGYEFRTW